MKNLALIRLDARLIHGAVVAGWIRMNGATHIIIIDDKIVEDPFLSQVLTMAAPRDLRILSTKTAGEKWKKDGFGPGKIVVLFQNVQSAFDAYMAGFEFPNLQIGNISMTPDRISVQGSISMNETDARMLQALNESGCAIVLRSGGEAPWSRIKNKYFPNI